MLNVSKPLIRFMYQWLHFSRLLPSGTSVALERRKNPAHLQLGGNIWEEEKSKHGKNVVQTFYQELQYFPVSRDGKKMLFKSLCVIIKPQNLDVILRFPGKTKKIVLKIRTLAIKAWKNVKLVFQVSEYRK